MGLHISSCGDDMLQLRRCLAASFFLHAALKQPEGTYRYQIFFFTLSYSLNVSFKALSLNILNKRVEGCSLKVFIAQGYTSSHISFLYTITYFLQIIYTTPHIYLTKMTGLWLVVRRCRSTLLPCYSRQNLSALFTMNLSKLTIHTSGT